MQTIFVSCQVRRLPPRATYQDNDGQEKDNGVEFHARDQLADAVAENLQEAAIRDAVSERDTAHGNEHHGPQELVEVVLRIRHTHQLHASLKSPSKHYPPS